MARSRARIIRSLPAMLLVAPAMVILAPAALSAQRVQVQMVELPTMPAIDACTPPTEQAGGVRATALRALGMDRAQARAVLAHLQDSLSTLAPTRPTDEDLQFQLALVLGARTEVEEGHDKLRTAEKLFAQVRRVLAIDPSNPGAQYLLGRLNAAVMRMSRLRRFVATKVLGASVLSGASWHEARRLLESAAEGEPCSPDVQYELARLYVDRGERTLAEGRLEMLARLPTTDAHGRVVLHRGIDLLVSLRGR